MGEGEWPEVDVVLDAPITFDEFCDIEGIVVLREMFRQFVGVAEYSLMRWGAWETLYKDLTNENLLVGGGRL